jgi:pimeloyl-ACP methyl ester carboxylesterase
MPESARIADLSVLYSRPPHAHRRAVLFIHGFFANASVFAEWVPFFAARGMPAYAVNLRGREGSGTGVDLGRTSITDFVADAAAVARHLDKPIVIGHSMGGLIAQCLAERGLAQGIGMLAPIPPKGIRFMTFKMVMRQLKYLPALYGSGVVAPTLEDLKEVVLNHIPESQQAEVIAAFIPDSGRAAKEMSISGVPVDHRRVRVPALVVAADDDQFVPLETCRQIAVLYHASMQTVLGHGHMMPLEPGWQSIADTVARWAVSL